MHCNLTLLGSRPHHPSLELSRLPKLNLCRPEARTPRPLPHPEPAVAFSVSVNGSPPELLGVHSIRLSVTGLFHRALCHQDSPVLWLVSELSHELFIPTSEEAPGRPRSALEGAHCHSPSKSLPRVTSSRKSCSSPDDMAGLLGLLWGVGF